MKKTMLMLLLGALLSIPLPALCESDKDILRGEPTKSYGAIDVILYETSWCPYCVKARRQLKEMGVSLTEYDIEKEPERREEMIQKSGGSRSVPLIDVEGIILRGYSESAIKTAVEKRRRQ